MLWCPSYFTQRLDPYFLREQMLVMFRLVLFCVKWWKFLWKKRITPYMLWFQTSIYLSLICQWYFSYIEILEQMCLFTHAAYLIGNCKDPDKIGKINQASTINEACPSCQKWCRSCRRQVGLCFFCHEPVNRFFLMCPGCEHGGHLEYAIEWFTSLDNPFHELCPTGWGHKCNWITLPKGCHFPWTESLHRLQS